MACVSSEVETKVSNFVIYDARESVETLVELLTTHSPDEVRVHFPRDPTVTEIRELLKATKPKSQPEEVEEEVATEEESSQSAAIVEQIKQEVEATRAVHSQNAHYGFFKALLAFSEQYPIICHSIEAIHVALDPDSPFDDQQHEFASGVLAEVILYLDDLKELTLQHFGAQDLYAPLATLGRKDTLKFINWEYNGITDIDLLGLLQILPMKARFKLVVANNVLHDEELLGRHLPRYLNVVEVELFSQLMYRLDENLFKEAVAKRHGEWNVPCK